MGCVLSWMIESFAHRGINGMCFTMDNRVSFCTQKYEGDVLSWTIV